MDVLAFVIYFLAIVIAARIGVVLSRFLSFSVDPPEAGKLRRADDAKVLYILRMRRLYTQPVWDVR
tara:strand:- start:330 stop:527 length:198 start_codon:yes stop_codon:yes gene_type:complete